MSSEPTFKPEPEAPTIEMWHGRPAPAKADHIGTVSPEESGNPYDIRVQGDWRREQDRKEYFAELEERRNRPVHSEGALNGLLRAAEEKALRKLVNERFGWEAPMHKVRSETLKELALVISFQSLRQFAIQQHRGTTNDVAVLQQRMDQVGEKLVALRDHLDALTAQ
jgi:hypothetical protein